VFLRVWQPARHTCVVDKLRYDYFKRVSVCVAVGVLVRVRKGFCERGEEEKRKKKKENEKEKEKEKESERKRGREREGDREGGREGETESKTRRGH